jgi:hypothetical protein
MSESGLNGSPNTLACKHGVESARKVSACGYKSVPGAENSFAPTLVGTAFAAGEAERGLSGRKDEDHTICLGLISPEICRPLLQKVSLRTVDGVETWVMPRQVPIARQVLRGILGGSSDEAAKAEAQVILDRLVDQGMCPECGEVHPYGGLCTSCLERQVRCEEASDAFSQGYRVDEHGDWRRR